jgi:hypothetical protein
MRWELPLLDIPLLSIVHALEHRARVINSALSAGIAAAIFMILPKIVPILTTIVSPAQRSALSLHVCAASVGPPIR